MFLSTVQPILATSTRVLIVSEERTIKEDLVLALSLQNMDHGGISSSPELSLRQNPGPKANPVADLTTTTNEREAMTLVESAAREHKPYVMMILDGRLLCGKDHRQILRRFWQVQRDLQIVVHAISQIEGFEQLPLDLGSPPNFLALKFRLVPFEVSQIIRTLGAKHAAENKSSHRDLSLNTQILESAKRFEDASNKLRIEQEHRAKLEEKLCKAQRLETIGRLSDGIAHFFNNYLTVIQGHLSIALAAKDGSPRLMASLEELHAAAKRVGDITTQLVNFNHRDYLAPQPIRLENVIETESIFLSRTLGEQITVDIQHEPGLPDVMADPACMGQIILNLAVHARDAMPGGGRLAIRTCGLHLADEAAAARVHPEARPGTFVALVMADTGRGLSPEELERLFDATALSKDQQNGKDLGLVLVQGLVRHQGGWVSVTSTPETGTEFSVYLPVADGSTPTPSTPDMKLIDDPSSSEASTILIVDDEDSVRQVMEYVLTSQGHNVLTARDANEAWTQWRSRSALIKLAIIDVKLPGGASGFDLERALAEEDPTLPVIFTCGYSPTSLNGPRELKSGENFLPKPFGMVELLNIVGQALQRSARL